MIPTAGLGLWLDAAQITGLADGASVTSWADMSGNGANATSGTAFSPPTYQTNVKNGLPVVRFVAASNQALRATFTDSAEWTMFVIGHYTGGANGRLVASVYSYSHYWLLGWWNGNEDVALYNGVWASQVSQGQPATADWKCYMGGYTAGSYQGFSGHGWLRKNGAPYTHAVMGTNSSPGGKLALSGYGDTTPDELSDGEIGEVICYSRFLTDAEITSVESYLLDKWITPPPPPPPPPAAGTFTVSVGLSGTWSVVAPDVPPAPPGPVRPVAPVDAAPPDTDRCIYRYVTKIVAADGPAPEAVCELTRIWITQP